MTSDSRRYLPPEALARIERLELRARTVVEGVLAGQHASPYRGQSVEFLQHREYVRGDDLRRVDWKVWGRQDRLYVKEFEQETNLRLALAVDCSASMDYPSPTGGGAAATGSIPSKYDSAATLAACLAWLALARGDAVGCATFDDRVRSAVPPRTSRSHLASVLATLASPRGPGAPPPETTSLLPVLRGLASALPRRGLVVIVSDLLGDRAGLVPGLRRLRARGHDVALFHVLDDDELDFPFDGPTRFEGLEFAEEIACNPRAFRAGYLEALEQFLAATRQQAAALGCDYELIRSREPLAGPLVRFLARRASLAC